MLVEFRVENHRSLRDEQVLSMESGRGAANPGDLRARHVEGSDLELLPVVALYGANASGKTNLLHALAFMQHAVMSSANRWKPDEGIPRSPFAWGLSKSQPSLFEVTMLLDSIRYQYGFQLTDESVSEEWLFAWPHGKKQTWFERDDGTFKFGEHLKGENKVLEGVTRRNALFLSTAAQFAHLQLTPLFVWFRTLEILNFDVSNLPDPMTKDFFAEFGIAELFASGQAGFLKTRTANEPLRERFLNLLQSADLGINGLRVEKRNKNHRLPYSNIELCHQTAGEEAWLPLREESKGTQSLIRSALPILQAIHSGGVILCDELEASLHPVLAQSIVRQFNDPVTNPHNAQLIFTTHDTNLLGTTLCDPVLRRDQIWLTEKDAEGATVLYPLTDFKPRKHENLERGYIQGRYGAIPFLGDFSLATE